MMKRGTTRSVLIGTKPIDDKHRSCTIKVFHATYEAAYESADLHQVNFYKCDYCEGFHLTSRGTRKNNGN